MEGLVICGYGISKGKGGPNGKIMEIPGGGGSTMKPLGKENPGGWGVKLGKTLRGGGMDIFWNHTIVQNLSYWIWFFNVCIFVLQDQRHDEMMEDVHCSSGDQLDSVDNCFVLSIVNQALK